MKDKKDLSKEVEKLKSVDEKATKDIYSQVKNLNDIQKVQQATKDKIIKEIENDKSNKDAVKLELQAAQELSLSLFKNVVKTLYPEKYPKFANLN